MREFFTHFFVLMAIVFASACSSAPPQPQSPTLPWQDIEHHSYIEKSGVVRVDNTPNNKLVDRQLIYPDHRKIHQFFREDGLLESVVEYYPDSKQAKEIVRYAVDGTTVASSQTFRLDGSLLLSLARQDDVVARFFYAADGKRIVSTQVQVDTVVVSDKGKASVSTVKTRWFRKNGLECASFDEVTIDTVDKSVKLERRDYYCANGTLSQTREFGNRELWITVYAADGRKSYRQFFSVDLGEIVGLESAGLALIEELDSSQHLARRLHVENGVIVREQTFDSDGVVLTDRKVTEAEAAKLNVGADRLRRLPVEDPVLASQ